MVEADAPVVNAMSIDVEDYFHVSVFDGIVPRSMWDRMESRVVANTERMLAIFEEFRVRSTFFVLGWVAERHPQLVRTIATAGHEVASHGYAHRLIYDQTPAAFRDDVRRAKAIIEDAAGCPVAGYRAPSYSITPRSLWALDVLVEEGYQYDSSIFPIRHDRYGIPVSGRKPYRIERRRGALVEVPGSTTRIGPLNLPVAGGGYFRLLPYWWAHWGISRVNRIERRPVVFYLHPWEIDPGQPRLSAGRLGRFRHYRHLEETEARLRRLLTDFPFDTIASVVDTVRRAAVPADATVTPPLPYAW
ncbi:MAG TPA: XrtA system polysaccharide deacetylase [Vicinamibacterales bacterium]|jgi:polysaccharide deacetylase family protein (PEP-CTERM system associated)|nr:XrtA system polysaccharide deacetylase [Vicinamibacterales bacterium]HVZ20295.1 XrtA system polysaccharide deacetylase [Vicinamibacterales bacterium]